MTIFISDSRNPQQPAFIYATFPAGVTVTADPVNAAYNPAAILNADEAEGYMFGDGVVAGEAAFQIDYPAPFESDCVAVTGNLLKGGTIEVRGSNDGFASQNDPVLYPVTMGANTVYVRHSHVSYSSYIYKFTGITSRAHVKHIAPAILAPLPFLEDNACLAPVQSEGEHLISHAGLFLGSVTDRTMQPFNLNFGKVDPIEEVLFAAMVTACVKTAQGLFFVPDTGQPACHFGWIDKKYKYDPKMALGQYTIPAIPFTARANG